MGERFDATYAAPDLVALQRQEFNPGLFSLPLRENGHRKVATLMPRRTSSEVIVTNSLVVA